MSASRRRYTPSSAIDSNGRIRVAPISSCARTSSHGTDSACRRFASRCAAAASSPLRNVAPYQGESAGP
jgi:hypothetical protein